VYDTSAYALVSVSQTVCCGTLVCCWRAEVHRESFMFWQNLKLQIFLVRIALLWVLTFHLNLGYLFENMCAAAKFRMY